MRFAVLLLHDHGRRRTRAELATLRPVVGEVIIRPADDPEAASRGWFLRADCLGPPEGRTRCALLPALHGVRLVRMTDRHVLIAGTEVDMGTGPRDIREHVQLWSLRPAVAGTSGAGPAGAKGRPEGVSDWRKMSTAGQWSA